MGDTHNIQTNNIYIYIYMPWKSKTKQRMVCRLIHIQDSRSLPRGKVWSSDFLGISYQLDRSLGVTLVKWHGMELTIHSKRNDGFINVNMIDAYGTTHPKVMDSISNKCKKYIDQICCTTFSILRWQSTNKATNPIIGTN